ncbi:MAG: LytR C-terminal domain-containing protein [Actinobacteria bacterium]|nr:LytR C-terminal domain-containing protein [Actinomycetota bacterium]
MTAPEHRAGGLDANARGIAVLVVAVLIGLLLLWKAGDTGSSEVTTSGATPSTVDTSGLESTTTLPGSDTTTTTADTGGEGRPPAEVKVVVLNGSGKSGVAASNSEAIGQKGYTMLTPGNAAARSSTTAVYYAEGYQTEAEAVAAALGKTPDIVVAKPTTSLGPNSDTANVVVVLGADVAPASGSTGSSGSASSTTTTAAN